MHEAVVYTTITGRYDTLKKPRLAQQLPMVVYSDDTPAVGSAWQHQPLFHHLPDPVRTARYHKLHPHLLFPDHEWSIWVDGSLSITGDLSELLAEVKQSGFKLGVYKHAKRDCLYQAAANCIDKQKDDPQLINEQMKRYQASGYPSHQGLVASGVLVRKHHDPEVKQLMCRWWHELEHHSRRDQLSFNYVCWQAGFNYLEIPQRIGDGRYFRRNPHNKSTPR
jgi:hypothetical protein